MLYRLTGGDNVDEYFEYINTIIINKFIKNISCKNIILPRAEGGGCYQPAFLDAII